MVVDQACPYQAQREACQHIEDVMLVGQKGRHGHRQRPGPKKHPTRPRRPRRKGGDTADSERDMQRREQVVMEIDPIRQPEHRARGPQFAGRRIRQLGGQQEKAASGDEDQDRDRCRQREELTARAEHERDGQEEEIDGQVDPYQNRDEGDRQLRLEMDRDPQAAVGGDVIGPPVDESEPDPPCRPETREDTQDTPWRPAPERRPFPGRRSDGAAQADFGP